MTTQPPSPREPREPVSGAYLLALFLCVPAGLVIAWQTDFKGGAPTIALALLPAVLVAALAYFQTRSRSRQK
jgi:hypothetical protein